ncbi:MAG: histidine kinase [candidate division Zixibacteria bacterium SM23_73_2]|nr:MAG: histidine kinase [candidate division Zixibacteria bacterium SM23_73_2]
MTELSGKKKEVLKEMIKKLNQGEDPDKLKEKFKKVFGDVTPTEISKLEQELVKEGVPQEEIHMLCEVHLAVFQESLEKQKTQAPQGHPIRILMEEHEIMLRLACELKDIAKRINQAKGFKSAEKEIKNLDPLIRHFEESDSHYLREENVLFPYLEKHGITQPPKMMWMEHDKIREIKKEIYRLLEERGKMVFKGFAERLNQEAKSLSDMLSSHFFKENNILFPTSLKVVKKDEWKEIRAQFDELGYCSFTPQPKEMPEEKEEATFSESTSKRKVDFETGDMTDEEIESVFNSLPVDITFIDKDDRVRYFSQTTERIFVRTKAVIGRKIQACHPQKSLHLVNQILNDFRAGKRDVAEFWINLEGKLIHIRYFPVWNKKSEYLGCVEVTQDITEIKKIKGEKRLL